MGPVPANNRKQTESLSYVAYLIVAGLRVTGGLVLAADRGQTDF